MHKVAVGHAVQDEHGRARGGRPGDQTGREVCVREWYPHPKGWRVFRATDPVVAERLARDMQAACANPYIGYDQGERNTLYDAAKPYAFDCTQVIVPCETDCSALVRVCCLYAGVKVGNFNTAGEAKMLLGTGMFTELSGARYTESCDWLKAGDILVTRTKGHTAIVLNDGGKAAEEQAMVRIKGGSVRVREGDGTGTRCLGVVHRGESYPLLGRGASGWYRIAWHGTEAYVSNKPQYTEVI